MTYQTILIIRHAEKPVSGESIGIDPTGVKDKESLTLAGWQRAGAWAELFAPSLRGVGLLPRPERVFASRPISQNDVENDQTGSRSHRPVETVTMLAAKLGGVVEQDFERGQEPQLATKLATLSGVVLVCWQHEKIAKILTELGASADKIPRDWPPDRFNIVFQLVRGAPTEAWDVRQLVPVMVKGDKDTPL